MEPFLSNKVVVKSFPVDATDDIEDFNKPILRKEPDSIIINVRRNEQKSGININLALQNESGAHVHETSLVSYFRNLTRAADKEGKGLTNTNKILEKTSQGHPTRI